MVQLLIMRHHKEYIFIYIYIGCIKIMIHNLIIVLNIVKMLFLIKKPADFMLKNYVLPQA